ncbi:hypothetical protein [Brevundimonas sp. NIBR11]|uniref:hypothetical protein n=1 Tax=Brevundimonas sp. NIBR11 TaxID=3015999 RepID=UPI0022EFD949|nr:hypothetical protein [Brevundimonas sp. NIBR11]WGM30480.1 hypothetical protein KKHFBJBL_00704 [Brevundimonas sp. NIBR11]
MSDHPDEPDIPLAPFPTAIPTNPFPPLEGEAAEPWLDDPVEDVTQDPPSDWIEAADAHDLPTASPESVNPLLALGRFAFPPGEPPDEEGVAARDRRWTSRIIVVATVFLLIFNAASIQNWSRQQAPGWVTTTVRRLADVWSEQMAQLGADQPRQTVRDGYEAARDADWPGEAIGSPDPG